MTVSKGAALSLFVLLASGPPALARASKTHVTFTETIVSDSEPEREWVSGQVLHFRGVVEVTAVTGDLKGSITAVLNGNINLRTGTGAVSGPFTFVTSNVTWDGSFTGDPSGAGTAAGGGFAGVWTLPTARAGGTLETSTMAIASARMASSWPASARQASRPASAAQACRAARRSSRCRTR